MTALPPAGPKKLGLVIDLDQCVGCHACAVVCKEWNTGGHSAPLPDREPYQKEPRGVWFNRVHTFEVDDESGNGRTVHFPRSCLHCEEPACVTVCPTGASYKRAEDGIVLVNAETCIGCKLCSWACPYGAREFDDDAGVMKKCTLCIDRIYNETLEEEARVPACVSTCPASARHFGDLGDPDSPVSASSPRAAGRPHAGTRLQAGQQVSTAARAPLRRAAGARDGGGDGDGRVPSLDRPGAVAVRRLVALVVATALAGCAHMQGSAETGNRHEGYYYPTISSTEFYKPRAQALRTATARGASASSP